MNIRSTCLILAFALSLSLILSACSSGSNSNDGSGAAKKPDSVKQVELSVWGRWEEMTGQMNETIAEFEQQYPNIKVNYTNVPGSQYVAQLQAAISGNTLPDLFGYVPNLPTAQLHALGILHSLNDVLSEEERAEYLEGTWSEGFTLMNGDTVAFPLFNPMRPSYVMYYNKEALQAAGLTEADIPATWDELYEFSQKVKANTDGRIYGLAVGVKNLSFLSGIITQMATAIKPEVAPADSFNYLTGQYELNSPGILEGFQLFKKLQEEKLLHPNSLVATYREGSALMENGQAVLTMDGSFLASQLNREKAEQYGAAPLPTKDGKPQYAAFQGESRVALHAAGSTEHYEEVKLFLRFLKEHLYPKLVRDGVEYSPIPAVNQSTEVNNPVAAQALKLQNDTFILIPRPYTRNGETLKVVAEISGKLPKTTLGDIAEGYLSGQIKDVALELDKLTEDYNKAFREAVDQVQAAGGKVGADDYVFEDWQPFEPYRK